VTDVVETRLPKMTLRSPWLRYMATIVSGGLFLFVWLILLMRDVNQIERRTTFPTRAVTAILLVGVPAYLLLVFSLPSGAPLRHWWIVLLLGVMGLAFNLILFVYLVRVSLYATRALGYTFHRTHATAMVLLTFTAMLSFVILQYRMNTLVERSSSSSARADES
jgi:hypothetical protein